MHRYGNPCLRRRAEPVAGYSPGLPAVLTGLWDLLQTGPGVALAAPQAGVDLAVVVVADPRQERRGRQLVLLNPRVVERFGPVVDFEEGCLSFPGLYLMIRRPAGVQVAYEDERGRSCSLRDDGLLGRILQHEIDHLQGVLFIDHLPAWRRILLWPRLLWFAVTENLRGR